MQTELIRGCTTDPEYRWTTRDNLDLSRMYNQGDWKGVQGKLEGFISRLRCKGNTTTGKAVHDRFPDGAPFSVVFLNEALEAPTLTRVLVQKPRSEVFGTRVSGFRLYDLQLFADSRLLVTSHFQATTSPNPLYTQIPGVLTQVSGALQKAPVLAAQANVGPQGFNLEKPEEPQKADIHWPAPFSSTPPVVYVVHLVQLQKPFKNRYSTVIPQVSATDQLSSGVAVEYLLKSLADRSRTDKEASGACNTDLGTDLGNDKSRPGEITGHVLMLQPNGNQALLPMATVQADNLSLLYPAACKDDPVSRINENLRTNFLEKCVAGTLTTPRVAVVTDRTGKFTLNNAFAGRYVVQISAPNMGTVVKSIILKPGDDPIHELGLIVLPPVGSSSAPDPATCAKALADAVDDFVNKDIENLDADQKVAVIERVENLYATYGSLVNPTQLTSAAPSAQYTMGRLTRYGFSLGLAFLGPPQMNKPAKISMKNVPAPTKEQPDAVMSVNTLAPDTPINPLTFVALDIHIPRYDETRFSPTPGERFRAFLGIALTPNPGVVGGLGFGIVRGLSVEGGYSLLLERTLAEGEQFGSTVLLHNPTPRKRVGAFFAGIGYSFQ